MAGQTSKGALVSIGWHRLGMHDWDEYFKCLDCNTVYPVIDGYPSCNGEKLSKCPYCKERELPK